MIGWIIFVALCSILLWKIPAPKRNLWAFLFLYKLAFLWFFFYVHQKYYSHYQWDFWLIFLDACQLNDLFWQNLNDFGQTFFYEPHKPELFYFSEQPRAFFTAKLFFFFVFLAQKNWLLSSMFALLLYLIASYHLSETLLKLFPKLKISVYFIIYLPSISFWTSGTSKEIWLLTCIWGMVALHLQIFYLHQKAFWRSMIIICLFFILWKAKYYYAFGIAFALLAERWISFWQSENFTKKLKWASSLLILIIIGLLSFLHPNLHWDFFPKALHENYQITLQASPQGSAVNLDLEPTWKSCLLNSYKGTWLGVFAPLPWQTKNVAMLLASIENTLLLLLIIGTTFFAPHPLAPSPLERGNKDEVRLAISLLIASLLFVGLMATFLGLSSPNFGTLSRYRVGFSWVLWFWLAVFWENWLQKKIKNLRKN